MQISNISLHSTLTGFHLHIEGHPVGHSTWDSLFLTFICVPSAILTIVGNSLVIVAIACERELWTAFNAFIINLSISDIAIGMSTMPFFATSMALGYWPFGSRICSLYIFLDFCSLFESAYTLTLISLDRCLSVKCPHFYKNYYSLKLYLIVIACKSILAMIIWLPVFGTSRTLSQESHECFFWSNVNSAFIFFNLEFCGSFLPALILLTCFILSKYHLFRKKHTVNPLSTTIINVKSISQSSLESTQSNSFSSSSYATSSDSGDKADIESASETSRNSSKCCTDETNLSNGLTQNVFNKFITLSENILILSKTFNEHLKTVNSNFFKRSQTAVQVIKAPMNFRHHLDKEAHTIIHHICCVFVCCLVPHSVLFTIVLIHGEEAVPIGLMNFSYFLVCFNSTLNPFLYSLRNPTIQKSLKHIFRL